MSYTIKVYELNNPSNFFTCTNLEEYETKITQVKDYFGYLPVYGYTIMIPENQTGIIF